MAVIIEPSHIEVINALGGGVGVAAIIGAFGALFHRQSKSDKRAEEIAAELKPDHGNSMKDKVDAIDRNTELVSQQVQALASSSEQVHRLLTDKLVSHDREFKQMRETVYRLSDDLERTIERFEER